MAAVPWLQEALEKYHDTHGDLILDIKEAGAGWWTGQHVQLVQVTGTDERYTWVEFTDGKVVVNARLSKADVNNIHLDAGARIEDLSSDVFDLKRYKLALSAPIYTLPLTSGDDPNAPRQRRICIDLSDVSHVSSGRMLGRQGNWAWEVLVWVQELMKTTNEETLALFLLTYPDEASEGHPSGVGGSIGGGSCDVRAVAGRKVPTIEDKMARDVSRASSKVAATPRTQASMSALPVDRGIKRKASTTGPTKHASRKVPTIPLSPPPPTRTTPPTVSRQPKASTSRLPPSFPSPEPAIHRPLPQIVVPIRRVVPQIPLSSPPPARVPSPTVTRQPVASTSRLPPPSLSPEHPPPLPQTVVPIRRVVPQIPLSSPPPARVPSPTVTRQPVASTSRLPPALPSPELHCPVPQMVAPTRRMVPQIHSSPPTHHNLTTPRRQSPERSFGRVPTSPASFAVPPARQERPVLTAAMDEGYSSEPDDDRLGGMYGGESCLVADTDASASEDEDEIQQQDPDSWMQYVERPEPSEGDEDSVVEETSEEEDQEMEDVPMEFSQVFPPFQSTLPPPTSTAIHTAPQPLPQPLPQPSPTESSPSEPKSKKQVRVVAPNDPTSSSQMHPSTLPLSPTSLARPSQFTTEMSTLNSSSPIKSGVSSLESLVADNPSSSQPVVDSVGTSDSGTQVGSFKEWSKANGISLPASQSWARVPLDMSSCPW